MSPGPTLFKLPVAWTLSLLAGLMAQAHAGSWGQAADATPIPTSYLSRVVAQTASGVKVKGEGPYGWRFVVRHPERPQEPYRHAGYQVRLPEGLKLANGDTAVVGTTDAQGRTDIIRVQQDSDANDWVVLPAWGQGPSGSTVLFQDAQGSGAPEIPYMMEVDTGPIYCGVSLPTGHSAYLQVPEPHNILRREMASLDSCRALQKALNPIVQQASMTARVAGIRRLMADPRWTERYDVLSEKLEATILREGSSSEIEQHVRERVYDEPGISKAEQSERLNGIAYSLLLMRPPRLQALANRLIDQSVALDATPFNLDTQGWARHQIGRHAEALAMYDQSLRGFQAQCESEAQVSILETMAHQAETWWAMGRTEEAVNQWADIARNGARNGFSESWANGLTHWRGAKAAIQARVEALNAAQAAVMPNCAERRDQQP